MLVEFELLPDVQVTLIGPGAVATELPNHITHADTKQGRRRSTANANGQLLVCTDGVGLVAGRDGTTIRLRAGESVWTPPGQEHWHGGTADTMTCHHAILEEPPPGTPPHGWSW